jgi:hypothetical protein
VRFPKIILRTLVERFCALPALQVSGVTSLQLFSAANKYANPGCQAARLSTSLVFDYEEIESALVLILCDGNGKFFEIRHINSSRFQNYQLRAVTVSMLEPECAFPPSSTSTQLPPIWLPVRLGTHTICFPPFAILPAWDVGLKSKFS